jgi:hypothetical protein
MFSSWDLVRPRFWYPMSSLEQSMMELEHMSDLMSRSRFPFDVGSEMLAAPRLLDDDDFFRDLPMLAREQHPATQHREATAQPMATESAQAQAQAASQAQSRDNDPNKNTKTTKKTKTKPVAAKATSKHQQQQTGITDADKDAANQYRRAFSSYSFSDSSIVDDKGRRVTSTRRRYEDSTGRLKAVHERQIEGKKLRSTWNRMGPDDEGQHEAVCSSGTADEFEALWQTTPFGEAQKKTIKEQQQQQQKLEQEPQKQSLPSKSNSKGPSKVELEPTSMEE